MNKELEEKVSFRNTIKIELILEFMKKKGFSEKEFADKCHITLIELKNVLRNRTFFEPITILQIARCMGVEFSDLVK